MIANKPWEIETVWLPFNTSTGVDKVDEPATKLAVARALYEAMEKEARIEGGGGTFKYWFSGFENQLWPEGRKADDE
jgi:hypothetical protein